MAPKVRFEIVAIDIDGDGREDGNLVIKYENNIVVGRKFVPFSKLKKMINNIPAKTPKQKSVDIIKKTPTKRQTPTMSAQMPQLTPQQQQLPQQQQQPVVAIEDKTSFGQYIKMGAGLEVGKIGVDMLADSLGDLFSG